MVNNKNNVSFFEKAPKQQNHYTTIGVSTDFVFFNTNKHVQFLKKNNKKQPLLTIKWHKRGPLINH